MYVVKRCSSCGGVCRKGCRLWGGVGCGRCTLLRGVCCREILWRLRSIGVDLMFEDSSREKVARKVIVNEHY